jgi:ABC-type lipoprotein release transport system permease subunit
VSHLRYAWRNLWRNARRTAITLAAVSLNTAILIASFALMDGLFQHTISNATNLVVGEVQIHASDYLTRRSIYASLTNPASILREVKKKGIPAALRSYAYGLVAHGTKSAGAFFWGVDPTLEQTTFDLAKHVAAGNFLANAPHRGMVLGKKLARSLHAQVGSEVVVVVQAADGSLGNELYTVTGILKSAGESIDRNAAIIHQADFSELFVSGDRIHEITLNSRGALPLGDLAIMASKAAPEAEVKTWRQLLPALADIINFFDVSIGIFGMIFFLAAGLGVMNTMLMATFERIREFGILKALGASPWRILRDVAVEALVLGFLSTFIGTLLGLAGAYYLQEIGLDTSAFAGDISMAGVAFDPIWRAVITLRAVVWPVVIMWLVCVLASLYPAALAARLDPVRAIQHV